MENKSFFSFLTCHANKNADANQWHGEDMTFLLEGVYSWTFAGSVLFFVDTWLSIQIRCFCRCLKPKKTPPQGIWRICLKTRVFDYVDTYKMCFNWHVYLHGFVYKHINIWFDWYDSIMHLGNIAAYDRNCFLGGNSLYTCSLASTWGTRRKCRDWSREWSISAIIGTIGPKTQF